MTELTEAEIMSKTGWRVAQMNDHSPIEQRAHDLIWAIEKLGGHPLLTGAQQYAMAAKRLLAEWHVCGEPGGSDLRYEPQSGDEVHERFVPKTKISSEASFVDNINNQILPDSITEKAFSHLQQDVVDRPLRSDPSDEFIKMALVEHGHEPTDIFVSNVKNVARLSGILHHAKLIERYFLCRGAGVRGDMTLPQDAEVVSPEQSKSEKPNFKEALESLINQHSKEGDSNTPDFILASYLAEQLKVFDNHVKWREVWYGRIQPDDAEEQPQSPAT